MTEDRPASRRRNGGRSGDDRITHIQYTNLTRLRALA